MGKSIAKLLIAIILIAGIVAFTFCDVNIGSWNKPSVFSGKDGVGAIVKGLDLTGGSVLTFEAQADSVTTEQMSIVIDIMRTRLDSLGYTEATVRSQGEKRVVIEIPAVSNPDKAEALLGQTAKLQFVNADGEVVLEGTDVEKAVRKYEQMSQTTAAENFVELHLTDEGIPKFAAATKAAANAPADEEGNAQNFIAIVLDGQVVSMPFVGPEYRAEGINSDTAVISGQFTAEQAQELASIISAGKLPFDLKTVSKSAIGATLGENALNSSIFGAMIGIAIVLLYMLLIYRGMGIAADIALVCYIGLMMLVLGLFRVNLTLPGIAGIILSIGMAVDANVIIFERVKEELRSGKTTKAAVESGFKRAFAAIVDSNITTLIAAVVLYVVGAGLIKGFAITLGLGIIVSMFTAIFVTKFLLKQIVSIFGKNPKLYCGR